MPVGIGFGEIIVILGTCAAIGLLIGGLLVAGAILLRRNNFKG